MISTGKRKTIMKQSRTAASAPLLETRGGLVHETTTDKIPTMRTAVLKHSCGRFFKKQISSILIDYIPTSVGNPEQRRCAPGYLFTTYPET